MVQGVEMGAGMTTGQIAVNEVIGGGSSNHHALASMYCYNKSEAFTA
jgi:hypothetical protein